MRVAGHKRVGILPESEETLIGAFGFAMSPDAAYALPSCRCARVPRQIGQHDSAMIENFLEFRCGLRAPPCFQVRLTAHVGGLESSETCSPSRDESRLCRLKPAPR